MRFRRKSVTVHSSLLGDIFFYVASAVLASLLGLYIYWQIQPVDMKYELYTDHFLSTPKDRDFLVSVSFCADDVESFTISRYYYGVESQIYYPVPDGIYRVENGNCIASSFMGNTGRLEPGQYEYHVTVSYDLNPIRRYSHKVAIVDITVE